MKIKVAHIITKLEMGGAQANTIYTVKNLNREKFETLLISGKGGILDDKVLSDSEIKVIFLDSLKREISPVKDLKALFQLKKYLSKEKPDIVHTHSSKAGILGRIAGFMAGIEIVIHTFHGFGFNERQFFLKKLFFIFLEKLCAHISDKLIFVSKQNINTAKKYKIGKENQYILIRSGIKISEYKPSTNKNYLRNFSIPENSTVIVSVGNFKPQKNPDDFYLIAKENIKKHPELHFIYIGGGDRLEEFKKKAEMDKITSNCHFLGWRQDISQILPCCDIFLLTSLWEGLPRSLIEAMLCGLVPLCYKTDGVLDIIKNGENGFLFDKNDIKGINIAIEKLLNKDYYNKIRENVLKTDFSEFDIDLMVKKQEELYQQLLLKK